MMMAGTNSKHPTVPTKTASEASEQVAALEVEPEQGKFGRYLLGFRLAAGGMASVYLARMVSTGGFFKPVVVKRMHPHLGQREDYVSMFRDEAQVTARLAHPNVCSLVDFGQIDGKWFMALEYLPGVPLNRVIGYSRKSPGNIDSDAWRLVVGKAIAEAAEGLHAAHELRDDLGRPLDIVHRDVSPQNIMVGTDGTARILDFGVARSRGRLHESASGVVKGKFSYMAPEEVNDQESDRRVDIWALGVCLWESLTGRRLFKGHDLRATVQKIDKMRVPKPSELSAGVPAALDAVTLKALARNPDDRYATGHEFAAALRLALAEVEGIASTQHTADWLKKNCAPDLERQRRLVIDLAEREDMEEVTVIQESVHDGQAYVPEDLPATAEARASLANGESVAPKGRGSQMPTRANARGVEVDSGLIGRDLAQELRGTDDVPLSTIATAAAVWISRRAHSRLGLVAMGLLLGLAPSVWHGWMSTGDVSEAPSVALAAPVEVAVNTAPAADDVEKNNPSLAASPVSPAVAAAPTAPAAPAAEAVAAPTPAPVVESPEAAAETREVSRRRSRPRRAASRAQAPAPAAAPAQSPAFNPQPIRDRARPAARTARAASVPVPTNPF